MNLLENRELLRGLLKQTDYLNTANGGTSMTSFDLVRNDYSFVISVKSPAMPADVFNIMLDFNQLTIYTVLAGFDEFENDEDELVKIPIFIRTFEIPSFVDIENIEAIYENEELKVFLPFKSPQENAHRSIDIKFR